MAEREVKKGEKMGVEKGKGGVKMTINEKMRRLQEKIEWFYGEEFDLETALVEYKAAAELAEEIKRDLEKMKNDIKVIEVG
jgi:exonuclease VII small subunit